MIHHFWVRPLCGAQQKHTRHTCTRTPIQIMIIQHIHVYAYCICVVCLRSCVCKRCTLQQHSCVVQLIQIYIWLYAMWGKGGWLLLHQTSISILSYAFFFFILLDRKLNLCTLYIWLSRFWVCKFKRDYCAMPFTLIGNVQMRFVCVSTGRILGLSSVLTYEQRTYVTQTELVSCSNFLVA